MRPFLMRSLVLLAAVLLPSAAYADVVAGKPQTCPSGTHLVTSHLGSDCAPDQCPGASTPGLCEGRGCCKIDLCLLPEGACEDGLTCKVERLCAKPALPEPNHRYREIVGSCEGAGTCGEGSRCEVLAACVKKQRLFSGCACDLGARDDQSTAAFGACALALSALGVLGARLRRRREARNS